MVCDGCAQYFQANCLGVSYSKSSHSHSFFAPVDNHFYSLVVSTELKILRSDEGLTLETSALYSLRWPIYIFNLVDTTKLPCYPHRRSTTVSLETFTLYNIIWIRHVSKPKSETTKKLFFFSLPLK